jgi:hypothetical protein
LDYLVIDGSGSMVDKWWDFMASADAFVQLLKDANLNSHLIATVFDDKSIGYIQRDEALSDWTSFIDRPLDLGRGYTPLYDAINAAGQHLRDLDPARASIIFVTDGDENCSECTDVVQAAAIIKWMRAKGWQVTFIGCDYNNMKQAAQLGVNEHNTIGVAKARLLDAAKALGEKRIRHAKFGTDMHFSDDEKQQFGGYLNGPSEDK